MSKSENIKRLLKSRASLLPAAAMEIQTSRKEAAEGGCGVIGFACNLPLPARHLLKSLEGMRNRGNGKGGGIAAVGLDPAQFGVSDQILENDYLLAVAYLEPSCRFQVELDHILPYFHLDHVRKAPSLEEYSRLDGLDVKPPEVYQYFVRVKKNFLDDFKRKNNLDMEPGAMEDEIVFQNSYRLNSAFYAATGQKKAFVLSHGKNLLVLKMVGYGDDVIRYYQLEDMRAHVWIGHHRYPTKGHVWHPGGAHPFAGLNEALVHNGDFANYTSICEYLAQRDIKPMFLTDTEVSVLVFDLLHRVYGYPLEYVIEALAPTTERDFAMLPEDKQKVYRLIQSSHIHCSPDGPWFFLIAQSERFGGNPRYRLTGITDTSMLRPQVFALQENPSNGISIGLAASEKQAIDAALLSLSAEDGRFWSRPDRYWNARGGSHTDGGAFMFTVTPDGNGSARMVCTDKFGRRIDENGAGSTVPASILPGKISTRIELPIAEGLNWVLKKLPDWDYTDFEEFLAGMLSRVDNPVGLQEALDSYTQLIDRRYPTGKLRRSYLLSRLDERITSVLAAAYNNLPPGFKFSSTKFQLEEAVIPGEIVLVDASGFPVQGKGSIASEINRLHNLGALHLVIFKTAGHRFIGSGLGADTSGLRLDVYGSPGDYLGSGIDGMQIHVHASGQDQLAQIMKSGKLVVHGDVGQTFGYAAKGGETYILGDAAGRPMINAVGGPRVVINGICLDYMAESFMAGNPFNGGGFVIINGIRVLDDGRIESRPSPYPGGNLFSLASGGAIYIRDPRRVLTSDQLNGGEFSPMELRDWELIEPYLQENEALFGIPVSRLLEVDGVSARPAEVYRKIVPAAVRALQAEQAWVRENSTA